MRVRCLAACPRCSVAMDTIVSNYQKQNGASDKTRRESSRETLSQKGSGSGDAEPETPPTPSKFTSTGFYGKRPSLPPGAATSQPPPPLTTEGSTSHRKLPPDVASPRAVKKATSTYSREDLLGSAKKKPGNGGSDSFTFDLPSPTTPSASLGDIYGLIPSLLSLKIIENPDHNAKRPKYTGSCLQRVKKMQKRLLDVSGCSL